MSLTFASGALVKAILPNSRGKEVASHIYISEVFTDDKGVLDYNKIKETIRSSFPAVSFLDPIEILPSHGAIIFDSESVDIVVPDTFTPIVSQSNTLLNAFIKLSVSYESSFSHNNYESITKTSKSVVFQHKIRPNVNPFDEDTDNFFLDFAKFILSEPLSFRFTDSSPYPSITFSVNLSGVECCKSFDFYSLEEDDSCIIPSELVYDHSNPNTSFYSSVISNLEDS